MWTQILKVGVVVAFVLAVALFSYQMGIEQLKGRDASLRDEVNTLSRQRTELELLASQMQHAARTAEAKLAEAEARLSRDVPTGDRARLLQLVTDRLKGGMDANRLAFVIQNAQSQRNCQQPENKRFVIATPLMKTGVRGVGFANGTITVTGEGVSARDGQGNPESWFDPGQPVTIKIIAIGGKENVVSGPLPLHKSVVIDSNEYRFTFAAGSRSFVDVTSDRCPFP